MSNFKVGQKVVSLITFTTPSEHGFPCPLKGEIYTVKDIKKGSDGEMGLLFIEIDSPPFGYWDKRFRPLDHAFADEVEAMIKEQVKQGELETV